MERQEQYSRRNCISIHALKEEKNEGTDDRVLELFREELNEGVLIVDVDRTYRIKKKRDSCSKARPVIVKFTRYNIHDNVFKSKKNSREKMLALQKILLGTDRVF